MTNKVECDNITNCSDIHKHVEMFDLLVDWIWTILHLATALAANLCLWRQQALICQSKAEEKDVWLDILSAMCTNGYSYSGPRLCQKWSNIEIRYCGSLFQLQLVYLYLMLYLTLLIKQHFWQSSDQWSQIPKCTTLLLISAVYIFVALRVLKIDQQCYFDM